MEDGAWEEGEVPWQGGPQGELGRGSWQGWGSWLLKGNRGVMSGAHFPPENNSWQPQTGTLTNGGQGDGGRE